MRRRILSFATLSAAMGLAALGLPRTARAQSDQPVYMDALSAGWQNWSWCTNNLSATDIVHAGADSIKITFTAGYQGFYLHSDGISTSNLTNLTFWIHGGATNGRNLAIAGVVGNNGQGNVSLNQFIAGGSVAAGAWRKVTVPLSAIGLNNTTMGGFWIMENGGGAQPAFYVDDIVLTGTTTTTGPVTVNVDAGLNRHAINPQIYGIAYGTASVLSDLNSPLNRQGGNSATRYNWQQNASNHASDYFFESISEGSVTAGDAVDNLITATKSANAQMMVTIPTIGWVAKLGPGRAKLSSFSRAKYGAQTAYDPWWSDAGNGVNTSNQYITGNNPNDANVASDSTFQQGWVSHIVSAFGKAASGGLSYYILDNEPALWYGTHRDVHPTGATMDEVKNKIIDYSAKIKAIDSGAQVVGPEEWGWSGYLYSGYDMQYGSQHGWSYLPDRAAHSNMDSMPWILNALHTYDVAHSTKSLDVFSLHYYPQGGEFGNDTSTAMQLRRNRSTRSLWDPTYVDETWINSQVQLIPRMKNWVSTYYPGLKTAITEYNWGAEGHINGATAQADVMGIFGRENLDMAARWTYPATSTPTYKAMKMYRNPDGNNNGFGDISVKDTVPDPDTLASFASVRSSDGALTVMLINKSLSGSTPVTLNMANNPVTGDAKLWQLTSANQITALADMTPLRRTDGTYTLPLSLPAQSITLVTVPGTPVAIAAPTGLTATAGNNSVALNWTAVVGATGYKVKRSATSGGPYTTVGTTTSAVSYTDNTVTNGNTYYYVATAVSSVGESANSNQVSAQPKAPAATTGTISALFGTGLNSSGNTLADSATDSHYTVNGKSAYVTMQKWPIQSGVWALDSSTSKWISPIADEGKCVDAPGDYTYQTTFTVTGDPTKVKITGKYLADNQIKSVTLNGTTVISSSTCDINHWDSFTISSGFVAGTNTLKFVVSNWGTSGNPSGFRCEMSGQ